MDWLYLYETKRFSNVVHMINALSHISRIASISSMC